MILAGKNLKCVGQGRLVNLIEVEWGGASRGHETLNPQYLAIHDRVSVEECFPAKR
jgi:hypothetical protein